MYTVDVKKTYVFSCKNIQKLYQNWKSISTCRNWLKINFLLLWVSKKKKKKFYPDSCESGYKSYIGYSRSCHSIKGSLNPPETMLPSYTRGFRELSVVPYDAERRQPLEQLYAWLLDFFFFLSLANRESRPWRHEPSQELKQLFSKAFFIIFYYFYYYYYNGLILPLYPVLCCFKRDFYSVSRGSRDISVLLLLFLFLYYWKIWNRQAII